MRVPLLLVSITLVSLAACGPDGRDDDFGNGSGSGSGSGSDSGSGNGSGSGTGEIVYVYAHSATELYIFAVMFGLSRANGALVSAAVIDLYGRHAVGSILGYTTTFHQLFAALGAWFGGLAYDMTGSYTLALAPSIALLLGGAAASLLIDEKRPERVGRSASQPVSVSAG